MNIAELTRKHPLYTLMIEEWKYLKTSYDGGEAYEHAALLYRYAYERDELLNKKTESNRYLERLEQTPLDNQCKSSLHTYSSYLWRRKPQRDLGRLKEHFETLAMLEDCDLEGTTIDEFMRQVEIHGHIFGHTWIVIDKSAKQYRTLAQERRAGARPYFVRYDPPSVWNWEFARSDNGQLELTYLKVCETETDKEGKIQQTIRIWTKELVEVYKISNGSIEEEAAVSVKNTLGIIPAVCHYSRTKKIHGIGVSEIEDIAKMQQSIYNDLSEMAQSIRNTNHNTLVKNAEDDASAGAGAVIIMDAGTESGKKPYLLQTQGFQITGLINSIKEKTDMINRMTHLSPVRNQRTQTFSGEALKTEFQLLNALLNEMAASMQLTEKRLLRIFCKWIRRERDYESIAIIYPAKFELRDSKSDIELLKEAKALNVQSEAYQRELDKAIVNITMEDDAQLEEINQQLDTANYSLEPAPPAPAGAAAAAAV